MEGQREVVASDRDWSVVEQQAVGEAAVAIAVGVVLAGCAVAEVLHSLKPEVMQSYTLDADGTGRASAGPVEERIIEYERKLPFKGFAAGHLFPNEPMFKRGMAVVLICACISHLVRFVPALGHVHSICSAGPCNQKSVLS